MAQIVLDNLVKSYGDLQVVHGINLDIKPKEFIVLVGPSGCGKSTTLRMIAGLEEITGGKISIGEKVVNDLNPKDRDIAMVFQNYALYPHMNIFDNMSFSLKIKKVGKNEIDRRVREAAKILGIEELLERRPGELSGGQRQRVAMGRAIVRNPAVFLFDEPLSNLDAKLRTQMRAEIKKLHMRMGTTVVYVTHDQVEAMTLADRIVILKGGHIEQVGTPLEIYTNPANTFVAGFIGSPPMNVIDPKKFAQIKVPEKYREKNLLIGARPEHIRLGAGESSDQLSFKGKVEVVEPLGGETLVHFSLDLEGEAVTDQLFVAKLPGGMTYQLGQIIELEIDGEDTRFFDRETHQAIDK